MTDGYKKVMAWGKGVSIIAKKKSAHVLYGRPQARLRGGRDLRRQIRLCQRHILCLGPAAATMALFLLNWAAKTVQVAGFPIVITAKGQLISKCLFGVFNFSQKMNENKSTWGIIAVKSNFFVHFLGELRIPKSPFEINWPLNQLLLD